MAAGGCAARLESAHARLEAGGCAPLAPSALLVLVRGVVVVVGGVLCGRGAALAPAPPAASNALSACLSY